MGDEEIAIIGMSGRFPGAKNVSEFWENLCQKKESISFFSDDELRAGGVAEHLLKNPFYVKTGFILDGIDLFDADFFHISQREAIAMDPQHRLCLECSWEALEDGGYVPGDEPLNVGVFLGGGAITASYLLEYLKKHPEIAGVSANFHAFCSDIHYLTTRISYKLNLTGPSLVVQTACSTSMTAIHLASESILRNECNMALAGGVSLRIPHRKGYLRSEGDILSSDGHCRTFDAQASGTVFGSGIGIVLLKKLTQAIADGDSIYAVIKKSSINNDGSSKPSYPAPSVEGQTQCMKRVFSLSKIDPQSIQFLEAHGTGTLLGDPTEIQSLKEAFGMGDARYCAIGSVKPNIGHTTAASGAASLIKLSLGLYHHKIPAHINLKELNPKIDLANSPFYINQETIDWPAAPISRRGAISSFGVGGTNGFAILEEAPPIKKTQPLSIFSTLPFTLSAKTEEALKKQALQFECFLTEHPEAALSDIAFTLNAKRKHFPCRLFFTASSHKECLSILKHKTFEQSFCPDSTPSKRENFAVFDLKNSHWHETLEQIKKGYLSGAPIDWKKIHQIIGGQTIHLPTYPFQRKRYWVDPPEENETHALRIHPLLGWKINTSLISDELIFENIFQPNEPQYLKDHQILNQNIYPAAAYVETFCAAAQAAGISIPLRLSDIEIKAAMRIVPALHLQTKLKPVDEGYEAGIYRFDQNEWHLHASARIEPLKTNTGKNTRTSVRFLKEAPIDAEAFYQGIAAEGYLFGPHFKTLNNLWKCPSGRMGYPMTDDSTELYTLYPPLFDGATQLTLNPDHSNPADSLTLPVFIGEIKIFDRIPNSIQAAIQKVYGDDHFVQHEIVIQNLSGETLVEIKEHKKKKINRNTLYRLLNNERDPQPHFLYHEIPLLSSPLKPSPTPFDGLWLFICFEPTPLIFKLCERLGKDRSVIIELSCRCKTIDERHHIATLDFLPSILEKLCQNNICQIVQFLPSFSEESKISDIAAALQIYLQAPAIKMPYLFTVSWGLREVRQMHPLTPFMGLHRTIQQEFPDHRFTHIDIAASLGEESSIELLIKELNLADGEPEVVLQEEGRSIYRIVTQDESIRTHQLLPIPELNYYGLQKGVNIEDLTFQAIDLPDLKEREVEIAVLASALNFRDVLNALNLYPGEPTPLGSDVCGVITRKGSQVEHLEIGQTVFGMVVGAFQNYVIAHSDCVALKPNRLTAIEAASIPTVFATAYYALIELARLQKGERILIHCAAGGVGLAAIQIAKQIGAEIFATASTPKKRAYLKSLGISNIGSSRTLEFADEWKGKSIHVVLNSLTGHGFIEGALGICAPKARFLELSKRNIWSHQQIAAFREDIQYWIVAIDQIKKENPEKIRNLLASVAEPFEKGLWTPLPYTLFPLTQIQPAFKYFHQTQHIGKVVIKHPSAWRKNLPNSSYLITGGLGELGIKTAKWLIDQGAKHICLISRTSGGHTLEPLDDYRKNGIEIITKICDVSCEKDVDRFFSEWKGPPFKGIIHAAGVLHTTGFLQHTWPDFEKIFTPKIQGAWSLHQAIFKHQINLDWIVYYSSISGVLGSHGNAAYSAANSFLCQFARYQQQMGLPAISINWGAWGESGMAIALLDQMKNRGIFSLAPTQAFSYLNFALQIQKANIEIMNIQWDLYTSTIAKKNLRFDWLRQKMIPASSPIPPLQHKKNSTDRFSNMQGYLIDCIRNTLGLPEEHPINIEEPFIQQGIDSLHAIEFLSQIERDLQLKESLRMVVLQNYPTVGSLSQYLVDLAAAQRTLSEKEPLPQTVLPFVKKQSGSSLSEPMKNYWKTFRSNDYNIGTAIRFPFRVNIERLSSALNETLKKNPIFYLSISPDEPVCKIESYQACPLTVQSLCEDEDYENKLKTAYQKLITQSFSHSDFPKCRAMLYQIGSTICELQLVCPHMIADGRSFHLLLESIDRAYTALERNQAPPPYSPDKDFLIQQFKYEKIINENPEHKKNLIQQYHKHFNPFCLPLLKKEKEVESSPLALKYPINIRQQFASKCQAVGIQLSLAFNSLAALALSLITEQTEFSAACASDGLFSADFSEIIGPFHKQLPLNISRKNSNTLEEFIEQVKILQPFWTYLREYPQELLERAPNTKIGMRSLRKFLQTKIVPKPILSLLKNKKVFLLHFWKKATLSQTGLPIRLFINELEIKSFSNFVDIYPNRLPLFHREDPSQIRIISLVTPKEWEIQVAWPFNPKNQADLAQKIELLIQHFILNSSIAL